MGDSEETCLSSKFPVTKLKKQDEQVNGEHWGAQMAKA